MIGYKGMKQLILTFLLGMSISSALADWFSDHALNGNETRILYTGEQLTQARMKIVTEATKSIYITTFIMTNHYDQHPFYLLLCRKSMQGVDVRVLVDGFGSSEGGPEIPETADSGEISLEYFRRCGVKVIHYNPIGLLNRVYTKHDKILVVDGKKVIIGGSNYGTEYSGHGQQAKRWYDLDILIHGPSACEYHSYFIDAYKESYQIEIDKKRRRGGYSRFGGQLNGVEERYDLDGLHDCISEIVGKTSFFSIYSNPYRSDERPIQDAYLQMMDEVESLDDEVNRDVYIFSPYLIPAEKLSERLIELARMGVKVHIITNSTNSYDEEARPAYVAMLNAAKRLLESGVHIYLWNPFQSKRANEWPYSRSNVFHKKGAIFGNKYAVFGSDNFDNRGQEYSAETISITNDKDIVFEMRQRFKDDITWTIPLTMSSLEQYLDETSIFTKIGSKIISDYL